MSPQRGRDSVRPVDAAAVVWDMDGTLLDSVDAIAAAFATVAGRPPIPPAEVERLFRLPTPAAILTDLTGTGAGPGEVDAFYAALAVEAEEIGESSTQWKAAGDRLREILDEWKTIRGIDRKTDELLWKRFSKAREAFNRRRGSHFADLDRQRAGARARKEELALEAEKLADSDDWGPTAARFRDLMTEWKAAGRAFQINWTILAAITEIESGFGCNMGPSSAGALGWTQFMPATWKIWGMDADGNGELGPIYGYQWRSWPAPNGEHIDQIAQVLEQIRTNPDSRRMIVSAWNVADIPRMKLPPCHAMFQFYVADGRLSCQLYQRSADLFLGVPFNIASYALLTHMLARECGLEPGVFVWTGGDVHLYSNHLAQARLQLSRDPRPLPRLVMADRGQSLDGYEPEDFSFVDYEPHPHISAPVAV